MALQWKVSLLHDFCNKSTPFLYIESTIHENDCCDKQYEYIKSFLCKSMLQFGDNKRLGMLLLNLALLNFNDFIKAFIIGISFLNTKRKWLSYLSSNDLSLQ